MTVDVQVETLIDRPIAEVAAYAADPTNAPHWYANIRSIDWQTAPPVAVGSRMDFVAHFLGRRLAYTYEVVELDPKSSCHAHGRWPVSDGDHLHVGVSHRRHDADETGQPGQPHGLLPHCRTGHGEGDASGHHQGSEQLEGDPRDSEVNSALPGAAPRFSWWSLGDSNP